METKRNKEWRKKQCFRVFKKRILARVSWTHYKADGKTICHPHWFELMALPWARVYKTTGTPCSCSMCSGEHYNRRLYKEETRRIILEFLDTQERSEQ